jgi:AbrB family looped-hinge helix DNA binding protein
MPLVKVRRARQITLPAELREQFVLEEGTYLEAEAIPGGILLKPVAIVERAKARQDLWDILDCVHTQGLHGMGQ